MIIREKYIARLRIKSVGLANIFVVNVSYVRTLITHFCSSILFAKSSVIVQRSECPLYNIN